jgi:hypothetical protein
VPEDAGIESDDKDDLLGKNLWLSSACEQGVYWDYPKQWLLWANLTENRSLIYQGWVIKDELNIKRRRFDWIKVFLLLWNLNHVLSDQPFHKVLLESK